MTKTMTLEQVAEAMVAPGKGILAADESTGTIGKRFDSIKTENIEDNRRDYREMLFRSSDAMKNHISGVILYDETIRQKAKDGTPLTKLIEASGSLPGIKVDKGTKPLPFNQGETITEGLDGLAERIKEYAGLGAKFAKWRAVYDITGPGKPSYASINSNAHALARYAALCVEGGIVPIVEPELLMDGGHDIDACEMVTEWILKEVYQQLYYANVPLEKTILKPNMVIAGKKSPKQAEPPGSGRAHGEGAQALRADGRAGHRLPVGRAVGRGCDRAPALHERARASAVEAVVLLRARACRPPRSRRGAARARMSPPASAPSPTAPR